MSVVGGITGLALWSIEDQQAARYAALTVVGVSIAGSVAWAVWKVHQGPPAPTDTPQPKARGTVAAVNTQLTSGGGIAVKNAARAWGQEWMVERLRQLAVRYHELCPGAPDLRVGDLSQRGGGQFPPHKSHRKGLDVDIGLPLGLDRRVCFLRAALADPDVEYIFYDRALIEQAAGEDPELGEDKRLRHWPGHKDHFHVRWRDEPSG